MSTTQSINLGRVEGRTLLDRLLGLAAEVHRGEGFTAVLLALNGFLILTAYYVIRPLRDGFLLPVRIGLPSGGEVTGAQIKAYMGGILAVLFLVIVPLYGAFAGKVNRVRLINGVTLFFVSNLALFSLLGTVGVSKNALGVPFYLWMGIFNVMVVAQFWSFANDVYTPDQGKRLFAIVGFGYTVGGIAGSVIISELIKRYKFGEFNLLLVSAAILVAALLITNLIHRREGRRQPETSRVVERPIGGEGGFRLVLRQHYLLLIGLLTLTAQFVNTNGNYILDETLSSLAKNEVAASTVAGFTESQIISIYKGEIDFWQNVLVVCIQFFLVSRIFKYVGISGALFVLPTVALGSYGLFAIAPVWALIRVAKITENATDYSLQNTLRRALFLPTSRDAKYKALQAVETFFWRFGDLLSGLAVLLFVQLIGFKVRSFAGINLVLVAAWILVAVYLAREHRRLSRQA